MPTAKEHRWIPLLMAVLLLAVVGLVASIGRSDAPGAALIADAAAQTTTSATVALATTAPVIPIVKTALSETVGKGSVSEDVRQIQQRLTDLGFAPGPIDGQFGSGTQQAVWAYEKLVAHTPREQATGRVTNEVWQGMQDPFAVVPRRPVASGSGVTHVEIYLPEQVLAVFTNDVPVLIAHISTGEENPDRTPKTWCEPITMDTNEVGEPLDVPLRKEVCAEAKTPGGVFKFTRRYEGKRVGPLGGMMNPVYFNYGIAVHGADNVPLAPASHGCVRLNQTIALFFPSLVAKGDAVYVWAEDGRQPEDYSKNDSLPSFNRPDPNATTTTTTTTPPTTVPSTTVPATTPPTVPVTTPPQTTVVATTTTTVAATTTT
jgi:peptidoglycan hydrolase-like protein with peptidoglycan-binding domain